MVKVKLFQLDYMTAIPSIWLYFVKKAS